MTLDRVNLTLGVLAVVVAAFAVAITLWPSNGLAGNSDAIANPPPLVWDVKMCTSWPDPDDPMRPAGTTYARDELAALIIADAQRAYAVEFVERCQNVATSQTDGSVLANQILYQVARYLDVLDRRDAYRAMLDRIAPTYPAGAYLLAKDINEHGQFEPETPDFDHAFELLILAQKGHDLRARPLLIKYAQKQLPVYGYAFPTLMLNVYLHHFDKIDDTVETRVMLYSVWEGYKKRCDNWEVISLPPSYQASIDNFMVPVQFSRLKGLFLDLPNAIGKVSDRLKSGEPWTITEIFQDWNTVKAYPQQQMWTVSVESTRDASKLYDQYKCSGPRTQVMVDNLLALIIERERLTPVDNSDPSIIQKFTTQPDLVAELT